MDAVNSVSGQSGSGSQDQTAAINQGVGTIAETTFEMMFNQIMQTASQFQETMQDDSTDNNS
jgi:hypothetical protein